MTTTPVKTELATFAAGCFWGVESAFAKVPGVLSTRVGYTAGHKTNPTYEQVCSHGTGHAEAIEIAFDPARVSYQTLLEAFFENHDPTTLNRQGPDVGDQYRSGIYTHSDEQATAAEEYHQKYFARRGVNWSCHFGNGKKATATHR